MRNVSPEQIDALLPQTQCGLCGYGACMPYAEAIVFEGAPINLCPPGGIKTLRALGELTTQDPAPFLEEMAQKTKPKMLAVIRENECIGCTKCIQACPVDAIVGSSKQMHTVIAAECTGCELCVAPCPVDCIEMLLTQATDTEEQMMAEQARKRFNARATRLKNEKIAKEQRQQPLTLAKKQSYIQEALLRAQAKKLK